eukprot:13527660-Alexandrium_andersonii.AAC.1
MIASAFGGPLESLGNPDSREMSCLLRPAVNANARSLAMKYPRLARRSAGTSFTRVHDALKRREENRINCQH